MYAARENAADTSAEEIVTALSGKYGKEEVEAVSYTHLIQAENCR